MAKEHSAKIGTVPSLIIVRGRLNKRIGASVTFRAAANGTAWCKGIINHINADGYMFIMRM